MNLILKIAAGIVLAAAILFLATIAVTNIGINTFSNFFSSTRSSESTQNNANRTAIDKPETKGTTKESNKHPEILYSKPEYKYKNVHVPGKPLKECMGPNNEINMKTLKCREGYTTKIIEKESYKFTSHPNVMPYNPTFKELTRDQRCKYWTSQYEQNKNEKILIMKKFECRKEQRNTFKN